MNCLYNKKENTCLPTEFNIVPNKFNCSYLFFLIEIYMRRIKDQSSIGVCCWKDTYNQFYISCDPGNVQCQLEVSIFAAFLSFEPMVAWQKVVQYVAFSSIHLGNKKNKNQKFSSQVQLCSKGLNGCVSV